MITSIAFFIFVRPDYTRRVWEEIRKAKPPVLLIVADGPRDEQDRVKCDATRAIVDQVDWPCDVRRNYSPVNMGCRERMASGLNWVFEEVEEAIILEDDCLPDQSFFPFCQTMLERYREDKRIMHIGGNNFLRGKIEVQASYYFSKYAHIWGWATWRRAWNHYDVAMRTWPEYHDSGKLKTVCPDPDECLYWTDCFDRMHNGKVDTWDYAWLYTCWAQKGLSILPSVNLVTNIGVGIDATNTSAGAWYIGLPTTSIAGIMHPNIIAQDEKADDITYRDLFRVKKKSRCRLAWLVVASPWTYGVLIRKIPILGQWWAKWRLCARDRKIKGGLSWNEKNENQ